MCVVSLLAWWQRRGLQRTRESTIKLTPKKDNSSQAAWTNKMAGVRAPKQWSLTTNETISSIEAWENNLKYILSLDPNFACFLTDGATWLKKTNAAPLRSFTDDNEDVPTVQRRTGTQKVTHLEMMLGQIANYAPIISRNTIVRNSTSVNGVWQAIRQHYGLQSTGSRFLDLANIKLKSEQRPEDL